MQKGHSNELPKFVEISLKYRVFGSFDRIHLSDDFWHTDCFLPHRRNKNFGDWYLTTEGLNEQGVGFSFLSTTSNINFQLDRQKTG